MKILITIFLLVAVVALGIFVYRLRRPPVPTREVATNDEDRRRLRERLAHSAPEIEEVPDPVDIDLSESGVMSVGDEIDRCIAAGSWDEALKWAHHAIGSRPDNVELKMKIAEIHCGAGSKEEFRALFDELHKQFSEDSELRDKLHAMVAEIIPDRPPAS